MAVAIVILFMIYKKINIMKNITLNEFIENYLHIKDNSGNLVKFKPTKSVIEVL